MVDLPSTPEEDNNEPQLGYDVMAELRYYHEASPEVARWFRDFGISLPFTSHTHEVMQHLGHTADVAEITKFQFEYVQAQAHDSDLNIVTHDPINPGHTRKAGEILSDMIAAYDVDVTHFRGQNELCQVFAGVVRLFYLHGLETLEETREDDIFNFSEDQMLLKRQILFSRYLDNAVRAQLLAFMEENFETELNVSTVADIDAQIINELEYGRRHYLVQDRLAKDRRLVVEVAINQFGNQFNQHPLWTDFLLSSSRYRNRYEVARDAESVTKQHRRLNQVAVDMGILEPDFKHFMRHITK